MTKPSSTQPTFSPPGQPKRFRFYFSFRSPFAGIAFYRLRRFPQFNDFDIELIPLWPDNIFGGHLDNPTDNLFKMAYIFADAARQAEEAGLSPEYFRNIAKNFKLPTELDYSKQKVGLTMQAENWSITHHAFLYAMAEQKAWAFGDAIFNRRFNFDGAGTENVMDPEVLGKIATEVGLDAHKAMNASASGAYDLQQSAMVKSGEMDGVFGVPFFAVDSDDGTEVFWGNDHLGFLLKALTNADSLPILSASDLSKIQSQRC